MPSSASQATGAARANSRNTARRKRAAAEVVVERSRELPATLVELLAELLTEPQLGRMLHELGVDPEAYVRSRYGTGAR